MNIQLSDITLHIDEFLTREQRLQIEGRLRSMDGIISVHNPDERPHLAVVQYNPESTSSMAILGMVKSQGVHAELIGL
jgi:hypothetical protein